MSEYLIESGDGGSIANLAYSPCGVSSTSQKLYRGFLDNLFQRGEDCLGRAVFAARCSVISCYPEDDSIYGPAVLWTLFGDPALRVKHSIASGVEENLKPQAIGCKLTISPSPCDASTTICFSSPLPTPYSLSIYDASGRLVSSQPFHAASFILPTSSLPAGVYVVRCARGAGSASARIVVRHQGPV
jgi:hypothetical protein